MQIIESIVIVVLSIVINSLSYYYLTDKHKNDKKSKEDYTLIKSLGMYSASILVYSVLVAFSYFLNLFAVNMSTESLIIILIIISYLIPIVLSFVHSNMAVEFILYLTRTKEKDKSIVTIVVQNILILCLDFMSLFAFIHLLDNILVDILRIVMLLSFILSFTIVIIWKESKPILKEKLKKN